MGLIQSVLCSFTICAERVLTWTCCAFLLILLMFTLVLLMVYGITVGYHYAQKELVNFAMESRKTTPSPGRRENFRRSGADTRPIVRLIAVNRTEVGQPNPPSIDAYRSNIPKEPIFIDTTEASIVLLESERPQLLTQREKEIATRLMGRIRRSKNTTEAPFLRPLLPKNETNSLRFVA